MNSRVRVVSGAGLVAGFAMLGAGVAIAFGTGVMLIVLGALLLLAAVDVLR